MDTAYEHLQYPNSPVHESPRHSLPELRDHQGRLSVEGVHELVAAAAY